MMNYNAANYTAWKQTVREEWLKYATIVEYLNRDGLDRYHAFGFLDDVAEFCKTAAAAVELIDSGTGQSDEDVRLLQIPCVAAAIHRLRAIAGQVDFEH